MAFNGSGRCVSNEKILQYVPGNALVLTLPMFYQIKLLNIMSPCIFEVLNNIKLLYQSYYPPTRDYGCLGSIWGLFYRLKTGKNTAGEGENSQEHVKVPNSRC